MVLTVNWTTAIELAIEKLPNIRYDIENVARLPVILQLTVFTRLRVCVSITIEN